MSATQPCKKKMNVAINMDEKIQNVTHCAKEYF